jgi:hypothetical protein
MERCVLMKWVCEQCEKEYIPTKTYQRFCNDECRKNWHLRRYHLRRGRPGTWAEKMTMVAGPADFQRRF